MCNERLLPGFDKSAPESLQKRARGAADIGVPLVPAIKFERPGLHASGAEPSFVRRPGRRSIPLVALTADDERRPHARERLPTELRWDISTDRDDAGYPARG